MSLNIEHECNECGKEFDDCYCEHCKKEAEDSAYTEGYEQAKKDYKV